MDRSDLCCYCGATPDAPTHSIICPANPKTAQQPPSRRPFSRAGTAAFDPAGRPGARRLPLTFWLGRCPNCRCTGVTRQPGWAEAALLGWTVGVSWA